VARDDETRMEAAECGMEPDPSRNLSGCLTRWGATFGDLQKIRVLVLRSRPVETLRLVERRKHRTLGRRRPDRS
jgi:hypothetical protein